MQRYICIHGHFYQPPRENAWLEEVELQDSAYPYHDWNERITAECYAPNAASRILDGEKRIVQMINNYARISFNFGPTLLAWMERNAPAAYQAVLEANRESQERFSGHGSALAQPYNHMILPLANSSDKYTQVLWGVRDFERRFGRKPEGMWLPETAVDLETLDIMAELGLQFTILAPHQASGIRKIGDRPWQDVSGGRIDRAMAYELHLPSRRKFNLFFYNDSIARDVAFGGLLSSGDSFAQRLIAAFSKESTRPDLVHIATDGETYGHHYKFGDMALAYALNYIESNCLAKITNYGEYLEKHPPTHEAHIVQNTSWSCAHGIERWRSDCGCNVGGHPGWNQAWRAPLRRALDWLRRTVAAKYEETARRLLKDPWAARDDYIEVVLDRSRESIERYLSRHAIRPLSTDERVTTLKLLELQRYAMLMFTSCGWFFDDLSGIETVQIIQYAGRVVQLAEELFGDAIEPRFVQLLGLAKSNAPDEGDGRRIYERVVKDAMVDLTKVTAHYAVSSMFERCDKETKIYCYNIDVEDCQRFEAGKSRLALGRVKVTSEITLESLITSFGTLDLGNHDLHVGVLECQGGQAYQKMVQEAGQAFSRRDFPEVVRLLDKHFGTSAYPLRHLFRDEQLKVMEHIMGSYLSGVEAVYRQFYRHYYPMMRFLPDRGVAKVCRAAAEFMLNTELREQLSCDTLDVERIRSFLGEAELSGVSIDNEGLGYLLTRTLERMMARLVSVPEDLPLLKNLAAAVALVGSAPFVVELGRVQGIYHKMLRNTYPDFEKSAQQGDEAAQEWAARFFFLGQHLSIAVT